MEHRTLELRDEETQIPGGAAAAGMTFLPNSDSCNLWLDLTPHSKLAFTVF